MRKIICQTLLTLVLFTTTVKAQIVNIDRNPGVDFEPGLYYKDLDKLLDPYVGTWLYTNGNTSLRIKLEKKEHYLYQTSYMSFYTDLIVGEFQYVENGNLVMDRIPLLNDTSIDYFDYSITCFGIYRLNAFDPFPEANPLIRMLRARYNDPVKPFLDFKAVLALNDEIENERLIFYFLRTNMSNVTDDVTPLDPVFPTGQYVLSKVP